MENINVTLGLDVDTVNQLASIVSEKIDIDDLQIESAMEDFVDNYDMDSKFQNWFDENIDLKDMVSDEISDQISDINWGSEIDVDSLDLESVAKSLLQGYNPLSNCSTAEAFTEAIELAIRHFLLDNGNVHYIVKALERFEKERMKEEVEEQLRSKHFEEFKQQLQTMTIQNVNIQNEVSYPHNHSQLPSDLV